MHVIALENAPSSLRGGQELNLLEICRGLSQRGHTISLIYLNEGNLLKEYQYFCKNLLKINSFVIDRSNITQLFNFLADVKKISVSKNSVVFSNRYHDVFFSSTLAVSKNIPHVCYLQLPPITSGFSRPLAIGLKGVKRFIAVSNQTKLDWVKSGFREEKIDVVHNGTNIEKFIPTKDFVLSRKAWNLPENIKIISYVGRLDQEKGLEILFKAFALILKRFEVSIRLLVAGQPVSQNEAYKKSLEKLVTDLGIEKQVDFIGYVSNTTSLYQASDVTVLPSTWSEPFGRTVVESMACGIPVVASRIGGIPEILTGEFQSGLFESGNEHEMSYTLSRMLNWREKDPQLGKRCREYVLSKFSLEKMIDQIEQVLLKALGE